MKKELLHLFFFYVVFVLLPKNFLAGEPVAVKRKVFTFLLCKNEY
jgi:hypothetical protein